MRRIRGELLLEGLAITIASLVLAAAITLLIDWMFRPALPTRIVILSLAAALVAINAYRRLVPALCLKMNTLELATALERCYPGLAQKVATVLELPELLEISPDKGESGASPSMVRAAVLANASELEQIDLAQALDPKRRKRFAALLVAAMLLPGRMPALAHDRKVVGPAGCKARTCAGHSIPI